jgi:hypothetical protein
MLLRAAERQHRAVVVPQVLLHQHPVLPEMRTSVSRSGAERRSL